MKRLFFVLILISCLQALTQEPIGQLQFEHLNVDNGLSQSWVQCIEQDYQGFMWFGTGDGLNRFDGYTFKVYKHNPKSVYSLRNNWINKIIQDNNNQLWLGTSAGLCLYNRMYETFYYDSLWPEVYISDLVSINDIIFAATNNGLYYLDKQSNTFHRLIIDNKTVLDDPIINCFAIDKNNNLWIGTNSGLYAINIHDNAFKQFPIDNRLQNITNSNITALEIDNNNHLWIGTEATGLYMLEFPYNTTSKLRHFRHIHTNQNSINEGRIRNIMCDNKNNLWIGTENGGLDLLELNKTDYNNPFFNHFTFDPKNDEGISSNSIYYIFQDNHGDIWIGTYGGGLNFYNSNGKNFTHFRHLPETSNSLVNNNVNVFYEYQNKLWIGTEGGLSQYNPETNIFTNFKHNPDNANSLSANAVWTITSDKNNFLWIGTWTGGICSYNLQTGKFKRFSSSILPNNNIFGIYEDSEGFIWICTMGGGLVRYNITSQQYTYYVNNPENPKSISDNWAQQIFENSRKELWVSTSTSLELFDRKTGEFIHFRSKVNDTTSFSGLGAHVIFEDSKNNMWFGTDAGLNLYNRTDSTFIYFQEEEGLPNNSVKGILEDDKGNLWLSTNRGISKMIDAVNLPKKPEFKNFDLRDGLQGNEFNRRAAFKNKSGWMYFGGTNGYNVFHPDSIKENTTEPPVVLTNFMLANKPVEPSEKNPVLKKNISIADRVVLKFTQSAFTIEFSALNFINSEKNEYAYKLEGFEEEWNKIGTKRQANYTNINPGEYIFKVIASNNDGYWNKKGAQIKIVILPPWYRTVWAYCAYIIIIFIMIFAFRRLILIRARLQHEIEVKQIEKDRLDELHTMKTRFFTNISHEFRTPLTLIIGPLEKTLSTVSFKPELNQQFQVILKNARRMLRLINQFMEISKIEAGYLKMTMHQGDLAKYINAIAEIFTYQAEDKQIDYTFKSNHKTINAWFDSDKIEKILYNLLSNAIKYTPVGGKVNFTVKFNEPETTSEFPGYVEFWIKDTGIGIKTEDQARIFDRFYQVNNSKTDKQSGTGIGLSLAQSLINQYGGIIELKSEFGSGTEFYFRLPFTLDKFDKNWIVTKSEEEYLTKLDAEYAEPAYSTEIAHGEEDSEKSTSGLPILLIVEDNIDLIKYIGDQFKDSYQVIEAMDGRAGIAKAMENIPDIIISDIMMPEIDGIELCRTLKTDEKTSHIPIILLTAKASEENQVEGLETGADDFLAKPFKINVLEARVKNLVESRQKLKKLFSQKINIEPKDISITSVDALFIQKAMNLVEKHMADANFNVDQMSREIGMSRASLHRKLVALTDLPPSGFIRAMRLKRSARLLVEGQHTVSEVLYEVGIKSRSYFTKSFKEMFGMSPTEYVESELQKKKGN